MAPGAGPAEALRGLRDPLTAIIAGLIAIALIAGGLLARELWSVYTNLV